MKRRRLVILLVTVAMLFASMDFTVLASETKEIEEQGIVATSLNAVVSGFPLPSGRYGVTVLGYYNDGSLNGSIHSTYLYNYGPLKGQPENLDIVADIAATNGTTIYAVANGTVYTNSYASSSGNYLVIKHDDGTYSYYGHMQTQSSYARGAKVTAGAAIGKVGKTGAATGYHLHFEWSGHDPYCEYSAMGFLYTVAGSGAAVHPHKHSTTPTPTQDPISFSSVMCYSIEQTTASAYVTVTVRDSSQIVQYGLGWGQMINGSYITQTDFSWKGSPSGNQILINFGKTKNEKGSIPSLSPGTEYRGKFYAITKSGKTIYSTEMRFTTKAAASSDKTPPVISNVKVERASEGYYVKCDVSDNVGITRVEFPTWTVNNGQDDLKWHMGNPWSENVDGSITFSVRINASDHNNEQGYYTTHIYAYDTAGNQSFAAVSPDTCVDWSKPTISDIKITDQTAAGYTIQCRATDNVEVSRVRFPVWTDKNGQDDIWWGEGTKNGNIYSFRVNISDHNHEYGVYHNHIYAYDVAGNQSSVAAQDCIINALTITKQPNNYIGSAGETAVFRIAATGSNLRYQWQYKTAGFNDWTNCNAAGSTTPELRFPIAGKQNDQTEFRCVVADSGNTVISQTARLSVLNDVKKYTVTFDSQGGTLVEAITNIVENTKVVSLPKPPVRDNFTFIGWYTEPNGQGCIFNENTIINEDMTVYAHWRLQIAAVPNGFWINDIPPQKYTGKEIKPFVEVYDGTKLLREKVDYTLSYKNNMKANDASNARTASTVVVKGKGNYSGTETAVFSIVPKSINGEDVVIDDITSAFNNKWQKPVPTVTWNGKKLKNKTDFTVNYPNADESAYMAEGTYQIEIFGKGNYTGKRVVQFTITNKKLMSKVNVAKIPNQPYTGSEITPALLVKDGKTLLEENVDYSISYHNNLETGTATAVLTGMGVYCGEKRVSFKIMGIDIRKAVVSGIPKSVMYTGDSITINPYLTMVGNDGEIILEKNRDYTISYQKNKAVGTSSIIFKGINNYSGTLKKTFRITPYDIAQDTENQIETDGWITASYMAGGSKPKTTVYFRNQVLEEGRDYTLKYSNNQVISSLADPNKLPTITVCGKGNFMGSRTIAFQIVPRDMESLMIEVQDKVYQNAASKYKSIPKITDWNGKTLKAGRDYESEISYTYAEDTALTEGIIMMAGCQIGPTDILPVGTKVMVTVTGKGNYCGTISSIYRITQQDFCKAKVKISKQTYTGSEICPGKEEMEIKIGQTVLTDTDYEIIGYKNNVKKGTATVILRGARDYGGTKKATFKIAAKGVKWWWR